MNAPATSSQRKLRRVSAFADAQATALRPSTKKVSGWFDRETATRIGVVATIAPARSPAVGFSRRLAVTATMRAAPTAASASGSTTAQVEKPKTRTKSAGIQNDPGILSRVTVPAGSMAPKKKFGQDLLIESAMAA